MRSLIKILAALLMAGTLAIHAAKESLSVFLNDTATLHGSSICGSPVTVKSATINLLSRTVNASEFLIHDTHDPSKAALLKIGTIESRVSTTVKPDFNKSSLLPEILPVDELVLRDLRITYDAETEGGNLESLRKSISESANDYIRQRLNASGNNAATLLQRFTVASLRLQDITVDAKNARNPDRQKTIRVGNIEMKDLGVLEGGISFAEIAEKISKTLSESIHAEALAQNIIDQPETENKPSKTARLRSNGTRTENDSTEESPDEKPTDSKFKKAVRGSGDGLKKIGRSIKDLFSKEK